MKQNQEFLRIATWQHQCYDSTNSPQLSRCGSHEGMRGLLEDIVGSMEDINGSSKGITGLLEGMKELINF